MNIARIGYEPLKNNLVNNREKLNKSLEALSVLTGDTSKAMINMNIVNYLKSKYSRDFVPVCKLIYDTEFIEVLLKNDIKINKSENLVQIENFIINSMVIENKTSVDIEPYLEDILSSKNGSIKSFDQGEIIFYNVNGKIIIEKGTGSYSFGRINGRIHQFLENDSISIKNHENVIIVDLTCKPFDSKFANICWSKNISQYELAFNSVVRNGAIPIDLQDIYVGIENNEIYFFSKTLNKRLLFKVTNSSSLSKRFPQIYLFLLRASLSGLQILLDPPILEGLNVSFLPEITYGDIILRRAEWKLDEVFKKNMTITGEIKKAFLEFKERCHLPNLIGLSQGEAPIVYNLENEIHLNNIEKVIRSHSGQLDRVSFIDVQHQLECQEGFKQYVYSFEKEKNSQNLNESSVSLCDNFDFFEEQCNNFYIYPKEQYYEIVLELIIKKITENMNINKWFYINYADDFPHIRFRFVSKEEKHLNEFVKFLNNLLQKKYIYNYKLQPFFPEISRYNLFNRGPIVYSIFTYDSQLSSKIFIEENTSNVSDHILLLYSLLRKIGVDDDNILKIFSRYKDKSSNQYQKIKKQIWDQYKIMSSITVDTDFKSAILEKNSLKLNEDIILSLAHMHMNRASGIDRNFEEKVYSLLYKFVNSKKYIGGFNE